jgi:galactosamine-6-phosphate isomerase
MNIDIYKDSNVLGLAEAKHIAALINRKKGALLCLAAGQSTICVFDHLAEMNKNGEVDFSNVKIVGLDEWCDFPEYEGSAHWILDTSVFNKINVKRENMRLFNSNPEDPEKECGEIEKFIADNGGIDYILLGVGMNGHVALNEPGVDFNLGAHVNMLAEKTKEVSNKYFKNGMPPLKRGLTLGFKNIFQSRDIVVILNGEHKAPIVKKFMELPVTNEFPVTVMKRHDNVRFVMDYAAARDIYKL